MSTGGRRLLIWVVVSSWVIGTIFLVQGPEEATPVGAYAWARDIAPYYVFAAIWLTAAFFGSLVFGEVLGAHWRFPVYAAYGALQIIFAISVFMLTWKGYPGAIIGTMQWLGYCYFVFATLVDRRPYERRKVEARDRDVAVTRAIKDHVDQGDGDEQ